MKKLKILAFALVTILPAGLALAENVANGQQAISAIGKLINSILPVILALAVLYFFWGLAQYVLASGGEDAQAEGRRKMVGGIIAIFVMLALWGIIGILAGTFGIDTSEDAPIVPKVFPE